MKLSTNIEHNLTQEYVSLTYYHSKIGTLITFQSYFDCIEMKQV